MHSVLSIPVLTVSSLPVDEVVPCPKDIMMATTVTVPIKSVAGREVVSVV